MGNRTTRQTRINGQPRFSEKNVHTTRNALVNDGKGFIKNHLKNKRSRVNDPGKPSVATVSH